MDNKNLSTSLVRGLAILSSFSEDEPLQGVTDLATKLDLNKSTVHRYVHTLKTLGYLDQDEDSKKYRLGIRVVDLGVTALGGLELRQIAFPYLEELATEFGHTVNMSILDETEIIYIERVRTKRIVDLDLHVGSRLPAYCTSMGKVLLAHLSPEVLAARLEQIELTPRGPNTITDEAALVAELQQVRRQGFATNNEELAYGLRSVAAPIWSRRGDVEAAINMAVHAAMISLDEIENTLAPRLVAASNEISRKLGYRQSSRGDR